MKHIPRHTHSVEIEFTNKSTKSLCFRATIPYNNKRFRISEWYKTTREAVASSEGVPVWQIKGKHEIIQSHYYDRILFEWPGGVALNMPFDMDSYDYKIVLHYLDGIKMSLTR